MFYGILVAKEVHGSTCYFYLYSHFKVLLLLSSTPNFFLLISFLFAAAAAAKLLQSCPTLCNPINGSPPGSPIPGILQARTLEWVAISFSNAFKWKVKVKPLSRVRLLETPRTSAYQAPPSMGFSRQEYWSGVPLPSPQTTLNHLPIWFHKQNFITKYYSIQFKLCFTAFMVFLHHFLDSHKFLLQMASLLRLLICLINIDCKPVIFITKVSDIKTAPSKDYSLPEWQISIIKYATYWL